MLRDNLYKPWFTEKDVWGIEICDGDYSGVVVQITTLNFSEKNDGSVDIDYHVINKPETSPDIGGELFSNTLELIINDILKEAIKIHEQARDNDSKESNS